MDNFYNLLFNPNHEMPSGWVLVVLILLCVVIPSIMRYIQAKREEQRFLKDYTLPETTQAPKKRKNKSKKKRK